MEGRDGADRLRVWRSDEGEGDRAGLAVCQMKQMRCIAAAGTTDANKAGTWVTVPPLVFSSTSAGWETIVCLSEAQQRPRPEQRRRAGEMSSRFGLHLRL